MSAIAGIVHFDGMRPQRDILDRIQNVLTPYGTDAQNQIHVGDAAFLRVLLRTTPEDGLDRQPSFHRPSQSVLVFDGRIDNRTALASLLEISSEREKVMADSDIVHFACLKWKEDAADRLRGDFTFAFWDLASRKLILARDALGVRPIYWVKTSTFFAFSTMPKGLFAIPDIAKSINPQKLDDYLCLFPMVGPESFYENIFRVEPGTQLILENKKVKIKRYHEFDTKQRLDYSNDEDYVDGLREQIERSVSVRLRSPSAISSELSGGMDSSTISAFAARILASRGQTLDSYTAVPREGFDDKVLRGFKSDEGSAAAAVASRFPNITHHLYRTGSKIPLDDLDEFVEALDRPPLNICNAGWSTGIKKLAAQRGSRVHLNGAAGNFSISYDGHYLFPQLFMGLSWARWLKEARAWRRRRKGLNWGWLLRFSSGPAMPEWLWSRMEGRGKAYWDLGKFSPISNSSVRRKELAARGRSLGWDPSYRPTQDGKGLMVKCLRRTDNGDYYAAYNTYGLEVRSPTLDRDLVEYCLAVPEAQYFRDGRSKWLLRRAVHDVLPSEILDEKKLGLQSADWYENCRSQVGRFEGELDSIERCESGQRHLDVQSMRSLLAEWPEGDFSDLEKYRAYRLKLLRGFSAGAFIRYIEQGNG